MLQGAVFFVAALLGVVIIAKNWRGINFTRSILLALLWGVSGVIMSGNNLILVEYSILLFVTYSALSYLKNAIPIKNEKGNAVKYGVASCIIGISTPLISLMWKKMAPLPTNEIPKLIVLLLIQFFFLAIFEEVILRFFQAFFTEFLMKLKIEHSFSGGVLLSAILFTVLHADKYISLSYNYFNEFNLLWCVLQLITIWFGGLIFAYSFLKGGLRMSVFNHMIVNFSDALLAIALFKMYGGGI